MKPITLTEITGNTLTFLDPYDIYILSHDLDKTVTGVRMRNNLSFIVNESPKEIVKAIEESKGR